MMLYNINSLVFMYVIEIWCSMFPIKVVCVVLIQGLTERFGYIIIFGSFFTEMHLQWYDVFSSWSKFKLFRDACILNSSYARSPKIIRINCYLRENIISNSFNDACVFNLNWILLLLQNGKNGFPAQSLLLM